jgi:RNA polymerase sigma-70 factor (ECF subfamily)
MSANLERLYDEHAQGLFAFLLNLTRHEADTRDLLQDLFIKLARQPALLAGVRDPRAYLLRLAHNAAVDQVRRRSTRDKHQDQFTAQAPQIFAPANDLDEQSVRQAISAAVGELPPDQRAVVHLKLWEDQTFEAIADTLGISINTAASRYRYGLDKLRQRLRPLYDEIL